MSGQLEARCQVSWRPGVRSAGGRVTGQLLAACQVSWMSCVRSAGCHVSGQLEATCQVSCRTHVRSAVGRVSSQQEVTCQVFWRPGVRISWRLQLEYRNTFQNLLYFILYSTNTVCQWQRSFHLLYGTLIRLVYWALQFSLPCPTWKMLRGPHIPKA